LPCLKQEAAGCLASTGSSIELVACGVKLRFCECARVEHRVGQQANEIKKEKTGETTWSDFLFLGSTDPVAKERLFLERFTCFQQG
jgi:hypothetical protein